MEHDHNLHDFGPFRLDANERVLLRAGRRVPLPAKAVSTLIVLVRNKGRVVEKDDLMKEVWPNEFVEEGNLAQHIFRLRRVFGETAGQPKYIETVPRRGYRFLESPKEIDASVSLEVAPGSQSIHSLAVLPFVNVSADPKTESLADSITEGIINSLSQLQQVRVRPKSAVFRYKYREFDAQQIGRELSVHSIVMGIVHLVDDTLTISTELIDVAGGWQVYGKIYNAKSNEILRAQEEIAKHIAAALPVKLTEEKQQVIKRYSEDPRAYEVYLKGRLCWCKHTKKGLEQAIEYFCKAIEIDSCYALAYAAIVDCYLRLTTNYLPPIDTLPSRAVPEEAATIQDLPLETVAAVMLRYKWDLKFAEREFDRAINLKSNYPAVHQWGAAVLLCRSLYYGARNNLQGGHEDTTPQEVALGPEIRIAEQFQSTSLTPAEEVQILCVVAREQILAGNTEAACLVLQNWYRIGQWPILDGLTPHSSLDLLFTVGRLAGNVGSTRQLPRIQKHAEALLNGAIGISEQLGLKRLSAEGQTELSVCYWREGLFDLARDTLFAVLEQLKNEDSNLRALTLIRLAMTELSAGHPHDAIARLNEAAAIVELSGPWLTSTYNIELAITFKRLGIAENRAEYFERATEHYREALNQFEAVGCHRYAAITENNQANLFLALNRLEKAEIHMIRARKLFTHHGDRSSQAVFDDTWARFYIAAEQFDLAEKAIARSIGTLEGGGEDALLAEALTTQGVVLCRMGRHRQAKRVLERAHQLAERCGDRAGAGRALMTVIEQMRDQLEDDERIELRATLDQLLLRPA
jgi:DNA-binding winged helix-turn-helix (wHTH) protein/tetratricopeptide (TPR) repeat protein